MFTYLFLANLQRFHIIADDLEFLFELYYFTLERVRKKERGRKTGPPRGPKIRQVERK